MDYELKDSGVRAEFSTGSVRDIQVGKGRFDLIPLGPLWRLARLYEKGAIKYKENNWRLGQPMGVVLNSLIRHSFKYLAGWRDEDHLAAIVFNAFALMQFEEDIESGALPAELNNLLPVIPNEKLPKS